jgi:H+-translocating NAD(P) transhydrogenase subunit alpha
MIVGVVKETFPSERRVALVPAVIPSLIKANLQVRVESGAGIEAGFTDREYESKGAAIVDSRGAVFNEAQVICQVRLASANADRGADDLPLIRSDHTLIGLADPLGNPAGVAQLASTGSRAFALELLPRITRAQSMDVLSSQATIAGHKAVLVAANHLPRMTAMMMTAAGTITAAKVFIIGAGVAGLQAIATAKRLGAVVHAYDVRPAVKEQVESLGGRFVQMELDSAEGAGGYAKAMDDAFYARQRELMTKVVAESDIVISTAAVPGAAPPLLITAEMVARMPRGSVIVDLAARIGQGGGNCEMTQPDQMTTTENRVTILGPTNLASTVPQTASQLFAKNVAAFVIHLIKDGALNIDMNDEIIRSTMLTQDRNIVNDSVKSRLNNAA